MTTRPHIAFMTMVAVLNAATTAPANEASTKIRIENVALQEESVVWLEKEEGWSVHRVFGLCITKKDTVLAVNEARLGNGSDTSPHHLVLKRSTDKGLTWGPNIFIERSDNGETWSNPTPIVDEKSGRIFLFYALNDQNNTTRVFYRTSDDDGVTWSPAVDVTDAFNNDPMKRPFHLPGPGHGLMTSSGRLVVPVWHRFPLKDESGKNIPADKRAYSVSLLISEDSGKTWTNGDYLPEKYAANESRVVELKDGRIRLNARSGYGNPEKKETTRVAATASPDGRTWVEVAPDTSMRPFVKCDAGLIKAKRSSEAIGREVFLFSRPDDPKSRRNTAIGISVDGGKTWDTDIVVSPAGGYSDLAEFRDGSFGLLYPQAGPSPKNPGPVVFVRFKLERGALLQSPDDK